MRLLHRTRRLIRNLFRSEAVARDLAAELDAHVELASAEKAAAGLPIDEARRLALAELGGKDAVMRRVQERRTGYATEMLVRDLAHGLRLMANRPGFTVLLVGTLALGLAASTAMFSVVSGVLLREPPYPEPDALVTILPTARDGRHHFSPPDFVDLRETTTSFADVCAIQGLGLVTLRAAGQVTPVLAREVSSSVLNVYGVRPHLGRGFAPGDEDTNAFRERGSSAGQSPPGAMLISHTLWQDRFGGDPAIAGRTVEIDFEPVHIVGVAPPGFETLIPDEADYRERADVWLLTRMDFRTMPRDATFLRVVARLSPAVTVAQARAEASAFAARQRTAHAIHREGRFEVGVEPLQARLANRHGRSIAMLFAAVGVLMLIACANLITLQLTRSMARHREFALRLALGAGRPRLIRQLLAESALLAIAGIALALPLARWLLQGMVQLAPASVPHLERVGLDGVAFGFACAGAAGASALVALVPAWRVTRSRESEVLQAGGRATTGNGGQAWDRHFVVIQVGLSVVLLVGTALLVRSLTTLFDVDPGFRAERVLTAEVYMSSSRYPRYPRADARVRLVHQLSDRISNLPGVDAAALALVVPLSRQDAGHTFATEAMAAASVTLPPAKYPPITPGYFRAAGTRLLGGRDFEWLDLERSRLVSIVDAGLASRAWPGQDAVGQRLRIEVWSTRGGQIQLEPLWTEVIGVAETVRSGTLRADDIETIYVPYGLYAVDELSVLVRTASDPLALAEPMRDAVRQIDPEIVVRSARSMEDVVSASVAAERFSLTLLAAFAFTGLALSLVGVYGVLSQFVALRRREIGIRMALGARREDVWRGILRVGAGLIVRGVLLGLLAAASASSYLGSLLFEVSPVDDATYLLVSGAVLVVGVAACIVPARRASRIDPVATLRLE